MATVLSYIITPSVQIKYSGHGEKLNRVAKKNFPATELANCLIGIFSLF